jgi:hypothetical protein
LKQQILNKDKEIQQKNIILEKQNELIEGLINELKNNKIDKNNLYKKKNFDK